VFETESELEFLRIIDTVEPLPVTDVIGWLNRSSNVYRIADSLRIKLISVINPIKRMVTKCIVSSIKAGRPVFLVILDLSLAFDTVDYNVYFSQF